MDNKENKSAKNRTNEMIFRAGAIVLALALWQFAAMTVGMDILLVSPVKVIVRLFTIWREEGFLTTILFSFLRIMSGFLVAVILGTIFAVIAGRFKVFEYILWPYVVTVKAVPVASFIIMCLIWLSYSQLTIFISFLIVFPVIYSNVLTGIKNTDIDLLEMAEVFKLSYGKRFKFIYIPAVKPYLESACIISVGMAFKAGVAAEVIGVVGGSIGEKLYEAKIYFDSADLFAWTIIIVLLSVILEKVFGKLLKVIFAASLKSYSAGKDSTIISRKACENIIDNIGYDIEIDNISKNFGEKEVLKDLSQRFKAGQITCVVGPSGCGKTTLFRIISGLILPDRGEIKGLPADKKIGYVFQEDRLCEEFSVIDNIALVCDEYMGREDIMEHLAMLELADEADKKVSELSGGMKRRVAIARAICYNASLLLLDEPFKGLDFELRDSVMEYVKKNTEGRTVILITHDVLETDILADEVVSCSSF